MEQTELSFGEIPKLIILLKVTRSYPLSKRHIKLYNLVKKKMLTPKNVNATKYIFSLFSYSLMPI